jgi:hypothetical protein
MLTINHVGLIDGDSLARGCALATCVQSAGTDKHHVKMIGSVVASVDLDQSSRFRQGQISYKL